jgi:hypothetical protein
MTRGICEKCFFVVVSKNEGGEKNNRGWKRADGKKDGAEKGKAERECTGRKVMNQAGETKRSRTGAGMKGRCGCEKNSRKDERGRRNVRIMTAAVEKMRSQGKRKTEVPGKQ